ncbi:MAG: fibronectin type III domain-containing protein [Burkholderiales bacterium]|nr:fibronectin type III domain-containing protein [Opitutaceae bacterium]
MHSLVNRSAALLFLVAIVSTLSIRAADLTTWPSQYTIRPWETAKLTPADVVGPDGIVYPDFTGVGVTGGIPDINNATVRATYTVFNVKDYGALGNGSADDDVAVAAASSAAAANATGTNKTILYFPTGTYLLSNPIVFSQSNVVIDGDGPASTILKIVTDSSITSGSLLTLKKTVGWTAYLAATAKIERGSNTATFDLDLVANGYAVGSWIRIQPTVSGPGTTMSDRFSNPDNYMVYTKPIEHTGRTFYAKITALNNATRTLTFDRTFTHDYFVDETPQLRRVPALLEYGGIQDLAIETLAATATIEPFSIENAANCWIKNIKSTKARNWPLILIGVTRSEVRDSQFLGTWVNIDSGGNAYLGWSQNSTDSLIDNCQASDLRHMAIFQQANRCVIRNSSFTGQSVTSPQLHGNFPHENLIETSVFDNVRPGGTTTQGLTAYASDGAATLRHGVEGPRNVFYNNRVNSGMGTVMLSGIKEGLIFAYNRVLKNNDVEGRPAFNITDRSFDGIARGNIFQAVTSLPFMSFEDPTCTGWSVTDNKIYGSNGYLYEGDSEPELNHNNRFFSAGTTPDAETTPEVASIYDWQKTNANTARLVLVIDRRTVTDTGGTTTGTVVRVKASTASSLTVALSPDIAGLSLPATVTIPAGVVSANFTLTGTNVSGGETLVTVTAAAIGLMSDTEKVAVLDQDVPQPNFGGYKWPVYPSGLPAHWKAGNFGQVTVAGTQTYTPGTDTWSITGGGVETFASHSSLARSGRRFVYQTMDGDGEIRARITAATGERQVGLMITDDESTVTDFVFIEPSGRVYSSSNNNQVPHGAPIGHSSAGLKVLPQWLRLKRTGFVFTAYKSTVTSPASEADWTQIASFNMYLYNGTEYKSPAILDQRMHYGMFINSGSATTAASATFTGVALTGTIVPIDTGGTTIPDAPSALAATAASASQIILTWTDNADEETAYRVERSADGTTGWTQIATLAANSVSHADTGLAPSTTYHYRVFATNAAGDSAASSTANASTPILVQTITFGPLPAKTVLDADFTLTGSASSGLAVSYASDNPAVATVSGDLVSIHAVGDATITASQPGDANTTAATPVPRLLTVTKVPQTITFNPLPTKAPDVPDFALTGSASSGLTVSYVSSNESVATVTGNLVNVIGVGTTTLTASQAGNASYAPAENVTQSLVVASGALILYEPFNYAVGANNPDPDGGANSGNGLPAANVGGTPAGVSTGLRSNWGATTDVVAGLAYSNGGYTLATSGAAARINNATWGGQPFIYRNMTADPFLSTRVGGVNTGNLGVDGSSLYVSLLASTSSATEAAFRLSLKYDGSANFYLLNTATGWALNNNGTSNVVATSAPLTLNTPTLMVLRFDFVAGTGDSVRLWVNPPLGAALGTPNATVSNLSFPGFSNFQTRPAVANAMILDELRLGTSFEAVTPYAAPATGVQTFRTTHGLAADGSQDLLMPAGDGVQNILKFAFNMLGAGAGQASTLTSPNYAQLTSDGAAGLPFVGMDGAGRLQLTFIRRKASSMPGVSYSVQFSNDVGIADPWAVNASASESVTSLDATFERVTLTDSIVTTTKRFVRVRVTIE